MDKNKIALLAAVDVSYLTEEERQMLWNIVERQGLKVKPVYAEKLRKASGNLTEEKMAEILEALHVKHTDGNAGVSFRLPKSICSKYFDGMNSKQMAAVVEQLKKIADEAGLNVTEDQLKAIAQTAYNAMKAGEKESNTAEPLEALTATPAATVVINTTAPVTTTEKVAIATDNVPEGATETNADGTVNLYDAAGNITGSVTKEEAEKMAAEVTKIVDEEGNTLADLK